MENKISNRLPIEMLKNIEEFLDKEEMESFLDSFDQEQVLGLRVNTLKISPEDFLKISPFPLTKVPWVDNGFYYKKEERPGKHPYYYAGLYYLQEPSAMLPAKVLSPDENSRVLDLCAAPGGKSTQLAELMNNKGCLIVNDTSPKRTMALIGNLVRMGVINTIVCNSKPETLAKSLKNYFTHILIDAPCSGEGMFRRDPGAINQLSIYSINECQSSQRKILETAIEMLENEGYLTYSTCTFNKIENEDNLQWLSEEKKAEVIDIKRIWPHKEQGEGQFASMLTVNEKKPSFVFPKENNKPYKNELFFEFIDDAINDEYKGVFDPLRMIEEKEKLFLKPKTSPKIFNANVLRPGWFLGELKKNRFEPSPDLALGLPRKAFKRVLDFPASDVRIHSYLKGETIIYDFPEKGWSVISVDGFPLGWFKKDSGFLKNYYPKNLRRMD